MNWAEIEKDWDAMQPLLQSYWTLFTHDDLVGIDRSRIRLIATVQRVYHLNESEAESSVCYFEKNIRKPGATI